jgi:dTMP kinase
VPGLAEGSWVVSDRFLDSSLAYQGAARGLGIDTVLEINRIAVGQRTPDMALVIDVPVALATGRRCATPDRIEAEGDGFLERVAAGYHELAVRFPERVRLVDGEGSLFEVHERVIGELAELL